MLARRDASDSDSGIRAQRRAGLHEPRCWCAWRRAWPSRIQQTAARFGRKAMVTGCPVRQEFFACPRKDSSRAFPAADYRGAAAARCPSTAPWWIRSTVWRSEKISFSSCIRPGNATIMRFAWLMRGANSMRRSSLHREYGGAVCPGRPDRLPLGRDHRRGGICRRTRRHLHPLRRRHRRHQIAQCRRPCSSAARPG